MKNAHSAEDLAAVSTLVHNLIGWVFLALAIAFLIEVARGLSVGRSRFVWPGLGAAIGIGLAVWVFAHQVLTHGMGPFADPLQNQHQLIGWLAGLGSLVELLRRGGKLSGLWAAGAWPTALVGIGVAFLIHEQGTTEALLVHWALAATLILAGMAQLAPLIVGEESRALRAFGGLLLLGASAQLIVYAESPGAHGGHEKPAETPAAINEPAAHEGH